MATNTRRTTHRVPGAAWRQDQDGGGGTQPSLRRFPRSAFALYFLLKLLGLGFFSVGIAASVTPPSESVDSPAATLEAPSQGEPSPEVQAPGPALTTESSLPSGSDGQQLPVQVLTDLEQIRGAIERIDRWVEDDVAPLSLGEGAEAEGGTAPRLPAELSSRLSRIEALLEDGSRPVEVPRSLVRDYTHTMIGNVLWEYVFSHLFAALATLLFGSKLATWWRLKRQRARGEESAGLEAANGALNWALVCLGGLFALFLVARTFVTLEPGVSEANPRWVEVSAALSEIQRLLQEGASGPAPVDANPILLTATLVSVGALVALLLTTRLSALGPGSLASSESSASVPVDQRFARHLALALVLVLLPYPVEALILPVIVGSLWIAILDLLEAFPHPVLARILVGRIRPLLFLSYAGAWLAALQVIDRLVDPAVTALMASWLEEVHAGQARRLLQLFESWYVVPAAFLLALFRGRAERREIVAHHLPKLRVSSG